MEINKNHLKPMTLLTFFMEIKPKPFYYYDFIDFFDENQAKVTIL